MNHNEALAAPRRIPVLMRNASTRAYTASLTFSGAEIQISKNGSAFVNAGGAVVELGGSGIGAGAYYYQASLGDVDTLGWIEIKITKAGMDPWIILINIRVRSDGDIDQNDESEDTRRIPIIMRNDSTSAYVTGLTFSGSEIQVSVNGGAWVNAVGTVAEIGSGAYYYPADLTEIATRGTLFVKASKPASAATWFYTVDVVPALVVGAPAIVAVSPTPEVDPGGAGGFPESYADAKTTPIIIRVTDPDLMLVVVTFASGHALETAYRASNFIGDFVDNSFETDITSGFDLTLLPVDGWPAADDPTSVSFVTMTVDAIDTAGNYSTSEFVYGLPAASRSRSTPAPAAMVGVDHVQAALNRVIAQFRDAR